MIKVETLAKNYRQSDQLVKVFDSLSLEVKEGEFVAMMGASGEGKTTLLQILGCLDRPSSGYYWLDGQEVSGLDEQELADIRNLKIGFVFQTSHFVDHLDLIENVALPGFYAGKLSTHACHERAKKLLAQVGLSHRESHLSAELSGGERQRAAIARAMFNHPKVILADEPTGNLDSKNSLNIIDILRQLNDDGITILLVTHDAEVARNAGRTVRLAKGKIDEFHPA